MFRKSITVVLAVALFCLPNVHAQNEIDALRYGLLKPGATARSISLGGAGGSFGGDFSSLSINPAGIGVYRHSKLMVTPTLQINNADASYLNHNSLDHYSGVGINNLGVVFANGAQGKEYRESDWKSFALGLGYNRLADFSGRITYSGSNDKSSLTEVMAQDAFSNGISENLVPPLGFLGYYGYLLYDQSAGYGSIPGNTILDKGGSLLQTKTIETSGGVNDWTLSFGGNYQEKLMIGVSLDLVSYRYKRESYFTEKDETGNIDNDFDNLKYHESLSTSGLGLNLKFGAIFVVNDYLRFGAALHTPTWSSFSDIADYSLTSNTENFKYNAGFSDTNPYTQVQPTQGYTFDYSLSTPWRGVLSATVFFGQYGFITADYSYVDFASMRYRFSTAYSDYEHEVNQSIRDTYQGSHNFRVGIEGRLQPFLGRIGFAYHSSPFERSGDFGGESMDFTAGVGMRLKAFSIDLAYRHSIMNSAEYAYPLLASGVVTGLAKIREYNNLVAVTFGYQF